MTIYHEIKKMNCRPIGNEYDFLIKSLENSISLPRGTRIQRLKRAPTKLLYSKILELASLWFRKPIKIKARTFWHEDMLVVFPELVSLTIYRYGLYEEGLTRIVLKHLKPGMTFFDVGAHFGYFSLLASLIVGTEGQVHTFEPTPSSFNILKVNVSSKPNVIPRNCAVFSKRKTVIINDYGVRYSAYNSIYNARLSRDIVSKLKVKKYEVEGMSVDDYVENSGAIPNFIKIDAESSEHEIIIGMDETINEFHPIISIEIGDIGLNSITTSRDLINFLANKGYQPYECMDGTIGQHTHKDEPYKYDNILFLPNQ